MYKPDFFRIVTSESESKKTGTSIVLSADYVVGDIKDLMTRGREFYAVWDEENGVWNKDENAVQRIVDKVLFDEKDRLTKEYEKKYPDPDDRPKITVKSLSSNRSCAWREYRQYVVSLADRYVPLDKMLIFSDTPVSRENYSSHHLNYALNDGDISAYEELISTLYDPEERAKIEWAIGAIFSGDSKWIQKFIVLYGAAGSGKSTILNIVQKLFAGYYTVFEAKALVGNTNQFATEMFRDDPLVAIQHDGDLSRIEDNTKLNSIVSHERMVLNVKYMRGYNSSIEAFIFMGTNKPVKITDAKSGIIRRLIDVSPSGRKIPFSKYNKIMKDIDFELGAIGKHCLDVYKSMGASYYDEYVPTEMMYKTDIFFNFVESYFFLFKNEEYMTLSVAYDLYKQYCSESGNNLTMPRYLFREELKNYFNRFDTLLRIDGKQVRSVYRGFREDKFKALSEASEMYEEEELNDGSNAEWLDLTQWDWSCGQKNIFDSEFADCPAQYATKTAKPKEAWKNVTTTLKDLDTTKLHYVKVPSNHIVIDFDIRGKDGEKSLSECLSEATEWPVTYAEVSRSGNGLHLHYNYAGDVSELSSLYSENIEVKTFSGNSSLRRQLSKCNNVPIATLTSGLPLKEKKMIDFDKVKDEKHLRDMIEKNLLKEVHNNTTQSVNFIEHLLNEAYESGITYDVRDLYSSVLSFAMKSSNQKQTNMKTVRQMKFCSKDIAEGEQPYKDFDGDDSDYSQRSALVKYLEENDILSAYSSKDWMKVTNKDWSKYVDEPIVFFDVEVFINLLVIVWKPIGEDKPFVKMINPSPKEVEQLLKMKLVGFNNRKYDNHILYARYIGHTNEELYLLSQSIINAKGVSDDFFAAAYNLSYADIYDFSSKKQSLKKFEIEFEKKYPEKHLMHEELPIPWDEEVPPERWDEVAEYCKNDVMATEMVFLDRKEDFIVRQLLSELSGLTVNHTTRQHVTKIIFGDDKHPQSQFIYTDLSKMFPGYKYEFGKSIYRGEEVGEGGYVYSEPGMYFNVALLDIASMHPTSIEELQLFGLKYTAKFSEIKKARICIKHGEDEEAKKLLGGLLAPFIDRIGLDISRKTLTSALKLVINSIYGYTAAKFDNEFKDPRNVDNIVAKRGALFIVNLKHEVQERGFTVAHIKTDSIKIPNATPEIIQFVMDYGKQYGYTFEHEATYDRMCLVNDAVYIAKQADYLNSGDEELIKHGGWTATGTQFDVPYVFKTLFSRERIVFDDTCETKTVSNAAMYLDFNEDLPEGEHNYRFVGRVGSFCPIMSGCGAGELMAKRGDKYGYVNGTKGYRWLESSTVRGTEFEDKIDKSYYARLVDNAKEAISKYGDFEMFVNDDDTEIPF